MSSDGSIIETSSTTNGLSLSPNNKLNDLYSTYETHLFSRSSSIDSSCSSNKNHLTAQTSSKESTIKLPYPVLSDHRDPSSVLILLQKETQTTSKKILDVMKQIEDCEKRLASHFLSDKIQKSLKYQRVQRKQQLDALKKHERRVNLQIDYMTTKTEIKGLEDEQLQMMTNENSDEYQQIEILLKKLKQKLDQMKIYMRTRNEQMKQMTSEKSTAANDDRKQSSSSQKPQPRLNSSDLNRKRPSSSMASTSHANKHFKSMTHNHIKPPVVRLASRSISHHSKSHAIQTPTVRFLNKTTDSTINSSSPITSASSSSTLSPPLIASTSTEDTNNIPNSLQKNEIPPIDEIDVEFDIDELFDDDPYSQTRQLKTNHHISKSES
jgi:hypothetical protein